MTDIPFVPQSEFARVLSATGDTTDKVAAFSALARINTLYSIARAGSGHIGSSFSAMDVVAWLHVHAMRRDEMGQWQDVYFSSKGHDAPGLYSVLTALGTIPFAKIHALRRLGGLPGHPDIQTPGMVANTGSLGMGVSKAKGMIEANRLLGRDSHIFVMTGDGELQEGQFWESLQPAANRRLGELTVIVDHNKIQSDTWVSTTSDLGDLVGKLRSFGWHVERIDGHDLSQISAAITRCLAVNDRPQIIIADTVKGQGVSFMRGTETELGDTFYRFHSGAPGNDIVGRAMMELRQAADASCARLGLPVPAYETAPIPERPSLEGTERLIPAYSDALVSWAERDSRVVALDADLQLDTGLIPFRERFPSRFIECGIAEQDMVSQAGGMALGGLIPVVHSFACFLSTRPNEQIFTNATERTHIVYVGSLAGLLPAGPGHSHQCVRDISALAAIPGMLMAEPSCAAEVAPLLTVLGEAWKGPAYLRLVSIPCKVPYSLPQGYRPVPGEGCVLRHGSDLAIVGYGPVLLPQAWLAAEELELEGVSAAVINLPWLNQVNTEWFRGAIGNASRVLCLDNQFCQSGQSDMIAAALALGGFAGRIAKIGIDRIPESGRNDEVLAAHGLDKDGILTAARRLCKD